MNQTAVLSIDIWLAQLGLDQYAAAFAAADIDMDVLPHLTDSDLHEIGVGSLGHRRKILAAIKSEPSTVAPAERRFITVLFCDLVGSTRLSGQLDAETYSELLNLYHANVNRVAQKYGGHVAQFLGDGALIYFGSPVPLEDAAARAAITAHELPGAVANLSPALPPVEVRIGIASGPVVVHDSFQGDRAAVGQTMNLAARLQEKAEPGTTVLSAATLELIKDQFDVTDLGLLPLKDFEEPQRLYRLGGQKTIALWDTKSVTSETSQFVNRTKELSAMEMAFQDAANSAVSLLVTGDAGMGKSRLVAEFVTNRQTEGVPVKAFACSPLGPAIPFFAFRRPLQLAADDGDQAALKLTRMLNASDAETQLERRELRRETILALAQYLVRGSQTHDPVILVEDLQWADPSTLETLAHLAEQNDKKGFVLLTSRAEDAIRHIPNCQHLPVRPLSPKHTRDIVRSRLGQVEGWQTLVDPISDRAGGVPIFAEELANEMRHRTTAGTGDVNDIPSSLQQSLQARIDRLGPGRQLLRIVSCIARLTPIWILQATWDTPASFGAAIEDLTQSGFAQLVPGGVNEPGGMLEIKHQMVREIAYDMILPKDRRDIHLAVANNLLGEAGAKLNPALLAEQMELGGQPEMAAKKWLDAGQLAAGQSADAEAVVLFKRALALLPQMPEGAETDDFEIDTVLRLYPVLIGASSYAAANAELSDRLAELLARETAPERIMSGLFYQWVGIVSRGDIQAGMDLLRGLHRETVTGGDIIMEMLWDRMLGSTLMFHGDLGQARKVLTNVTSRYIREKHETALAKFGATDNYITSLCCLAAIDALEDQPDSAQLALAAAEERGHVHTLCHTLAFGVGLPAVIREDWPVALFAADSLLQFGEDRDLFLWRTFGAVIQSITSTSEGAVDEGSARFSAACQSLSQQGFNFMIPTFRALFIRTKNAHREPDPEELSQIIKALSSGERWMLPIVEATLNVDASGGAEKP